MNSSATLLPPVRRRTFTDVQIGLAFVAGCTLGASLVGCGLVVVGALLSPVPHAWRLGLGALLAAVILLAEREVRGLRLPQTARQIPATVVAQRRPGNAWRFAVPYGTGLRTYLPSASPHVLAVGLVLTAPSAAILGAAAAFGVGRGLSLLMRSFTRQRDAYGEIFQRITQVLRPVTPVVVLALVVMADIRA